MRRARTPEGAVKASIRQFCRQFLGDKLALYAIIGGPLQAPGIADYLGCYEGKAVAIEVKAPGGKQSPKQKEFQAAWETAGGIYCLAYGPEDVAKALGVKGLLW